jgi:hypothetical protein
MVLLLVGLKMFFAETLKLALGQNFNLYLLGTVLSILTAGIFASVFADRYERRGGDLSDDSWPSP